MGSERGKVYLIGAGPGDPGLITVKGRECLAKADIVIYDYLANPRLLDYARPDADKVYVGKRSHQHTVEQDEINSLLIKEAGLGRRVARLKGGDAFIFGRGGEEALSLAENGIDFEIVPGVSSAYAVPAYAGIPVTHRGLAANVSFITGHEQRDGAGPGIAWELLAKGGGTLVFLMGVKNLPIITEELRRHGKPARTPTAVVRWGTTPEQATLTGTLENIVEKVRTADFHPPAVIVVGEVVGLREKLAWFEKKPLFGRRIVITRAAGQAGGLGELLAEAGAEIITFPTIVIRPVADYSVFDQAVSELQAGGATYDWTIFTSANAVKFTFRRLEDLGLDIRTLGKTNLAAAGSATAAALAKNHLRADLVPADFRAEGLIAELAGKGVEGRKILIPRAREAREILPDQLRRLGAEVTVAPVYQNVPADPPTGELREAFASGKIDCVAFTSGSTLDNFMRLMGVPEDGPGRLVLGGVKTAVIGPVTAEAAEKYGLAADIMPAKATIPALAEAIKSNFC